MDAWFLMNLKHWGLHLGAWGEDVDDVEPLVCVVGVGEAAPTVGAWGGDLYVF